MTAPTLYEAPADPELFSAICDTLGSAITRHSPFPPPPDLTHHRSFQDGAGTLRGPQRVFRSV